MVKILIDHKKDCKHSNEQRILKFKCTTPNHSLPPTISACKTLFCTVLKVCVEVCGKLWVGVTFSSKYLLVLLQFTQKRILQNLLVEASRSFLYLPPYCSQVENNCCTISKLVLSNLNLSWFQFVCFRLVSTKSQSRERKRG